jgi:NADPH:quinone reductase-like Zn-dependent oxidoreductase
MEYRRIGRDYPPVMPIRPERPRPMRAFKIPASYSLKDLKQVDVPEPGSPGPGEICVIMEAVSLNYRDLLVARGQDRWRPPAGRIPVSDGVGIVDAVGLGVSRVRRGERVMTTILPNWIDGPMTAEKREGGLGGPARDGVLAERVVLAADSVVAVPDYLRSVEAAALPCAGVTAWHALSRAGSLSPGATVLVQGTGGVALFALQLAVSAGATVFATSSSEAKMRKLRELGAAATIDYRAQPDWDCEVLRLTGGAGVRHVIDIGGGGSLRRSMSAVAVEGIVSIVGLVGGMTAEIDIGVAFQKNLRLDGIETGSRAMLEDFARWMEERRIRPVIDAVYPFDEAPKAFSRMEDGAHVGKVCIDMLA